jgi:DNA-binding NarL/FixJ family response regulator
VETLIVDDEEDMRSLVRTTIEIANKGLRVMGEAANGVEALAQWREARPDCIVIDQRMPGLTGIDVCREILAEDPSQRIVLFTAFADAELRRTAKDIGISVVLAKEHVHKLPETLWGLAA